MSADGNLDDEIHSGKCRAWLKRNERCSAHCVAERSMHAGKE
jgi:hypothetical protein